MKQKLSPKVVKRLSGTAFYLNSKIGEIISLIAKRTGNSMKISEETSPIWPERGKMNEFSSHKRKNFAYSGAIAWLSGNKRTFFAYFESCVSLYPLPITTSSTKGHSAAWPPINHDDAKCRTHQTSTHSHFIHTPAPEREDWAKEEDKRLSAWLLPKAMS